MPWLPSPAVQGSAWSPMDVRGRQPWRGAPALLAKERHSGYLNVASDCVAVCILMLSKVR